MPFSNLLSFVPSPVISSRTRPIHFCLFAAPLAVVWRDSISERTSEQRTSTGYLIIAASLSLFFCARDQHGALSHSTESAAGVNLSLLSIDALKFSFLFKLKTVTVTWGSNDQVDRALFFFLLFRRRIDRLSHEWKVFLYLELFQQPPFYCKEGRDVDSSAKRQSSTPSATISILSRWTIVFILILPCGCDGWTCASFPLINNLYSTQR